MALLFSAVTVKREVDDGILPDGPWFSAANSMPITVKCEVDGDGGSAVDDVDHLPLKERMEMLLVGGLSGSSLGIESSGRVPMCCVNAAVKEKACFLEDISTRDSARVKRSTSVCCAGESKEGGHSKDAGQEQSYTDGGPVTNAIEVPTIAIPVHSCEAALCSSTANKFHDTGSTRENNLQEAKVNGHICSCLVPCPEAKGLVVGEVDTNSYNSSSSLISPCRDGEGGLSSVDMQTVQVKSEIQDQPEIDKLDHISLQERCKMLFMTRGSVLGDFYDSKCSQISGPRALRSSLQQEVSLGDLAHLVKDGHTADSKFTKEHDYADNIHDTSDGQSNGFKKANMHEVKTNDPTCSYQLSLPEVRAPIVGREKVGVNAGNELLPFSSFPIQVKVENENLENGLIGPCSNGSGSFPNADIVAVKVKMGINDEFHADDLDHIPLQERIKKLVASRDSNLDFSRDLNCLQDNVPCTLEHDTVGPVDVKTSGMTVRRRRKKAVKGSKDTACSPCPPGYNPIVSVKSEASCLTLPQKRKKIAMDLVEKVHVPYVPECDPIDSRNAEARHSTLRRKRKKTVVDSVEAALEEDAPGLLQVLVERGIKVDELKLYGEAEDEGALDISDSEDGFGELETVISKLFSQPSHLLKFAPLRRAKGSRVSYYCLACLVSLIEQTRYLQFRKWPVEWGWCRDLQSFIFVFERHNRIVLERPEYGYATYFFELVGSLPIDWQIKRLVTTMRLTSFSRTTLIENKALLVGEDLTEGEARVLEEYGWIPNSGLGTMLNYCDRVVHDRKNEGNISDWRCKIGKLLMNGHDGGSIVLFNLPKKVVEYKGNQSLQIKLELEAEIV
ncbi:uncharacterized protein LOC131251490 isoform X2 [Magnolia sinica]|uniref:uncharacterized protein LOC131251490 isoform X2 n=1 Tax=Magnolia sinica TaxID=86752 RepID=UPI002659B260|nr:uncharacterized protein LOC131251490 isoform X2 [Magnolia sinica]